jgi:hypothetical protein
MSNAGIAISANEIAQNYSIKADTLSFDTTPINKQMFYLHPNIGT